MNVIPFGYWIGAGIVSLLLLVSAIWYANYYCGYNQKPKGSP